LKGLGGSQLPAQYSFRIGLFASLMAVPARQEPKKRPGVAMTPGLVAHQRVDQVS